MTRGEWQRLRDRSYEGLRVALGIAVFTGLFVSLVPAGLRGDRLTVPRPAAIVFTSDREALEHTARLSRPPAAQPKGSGDADKPVAAIEPPAPVSVPVAPEPSATLGAAIRPSLSPEQQSSMRQEAPGPASGPSVLPRPVAIDSATLVSGMSRVRLSGVTAIEPARECKVSGRTWRCGAQARTALRGWLRARSIECLVPDDFATRRQDVETSCTLGVDDIAGWLVENGWAEAVQDGPYEEAGRQAREAGRGIWGAGG